MDGDTMAMDVAATRGLLPRGGTVLGTSRTNPYAVDGGPERVMATLERLGIDALVPIGGGEPPRGPAKAARPRRPAGGAPTRRHKDPPPAAPHLGVHPPPGR